jgi:hypothetical protein
MNTEDIFEQDVQEYQRAILEMLARMNRYGFWDNREPEVIARFQTLARTDRPYFYRLCGRLLADDRREIRQGILKLIGSCKMRDHVLARVLVTIAHNQHSLREEALLALWGVRTRRVLPQLLSFAEKGYPHALAMTWRMLQTPEEIAQGIAIARKYIAADDYEMREGALFLLQRFSTMDLEANLVLAAVQKYKDELFIDALKKAPPEVVLEPLKALRSTIAEKYAEYGDLSSTIAVLERKSAEEMN